MSNALVLSPHTDDAELGCAGTISKLIEKKWSVHILYFTACDSKILIEEARQSSKILGVTYEILDLTVREFPRERQKILEFLYSISKTDKYNLIFTPATTDLHQDHEVVTNEAKRAFRSCTLLGYELPWNNLSVTLNGFIKLKKSHVEQKISALNCYNSQKTNHYFNQDFFRAVLRTRGVQLATEYAEGFQVIRVALDNLL